MRQLTTLLLSLILSTCYCRAQYVVKGDVTDTLNNMKLGYASAVLIRTSDSVIESFNRSDDKGHVELKASKEGKYLLRVTFPTFADYVDVVTIKKQNTDLGIIPMVSKERLLKEFVLTKQYAAIKIKGDTTEYVADSFKTKDNATVEDLLKKLPGIQVDKNGQITAQGETVAKILVDGEEFFSDDPKVVTKGLQANAIDKVQVFDKKSDQAEFTGIDDGQKIKTINLELKEDKKKGYFGKIDAGGGTDGYFQNQGMINAFKAKRQLSAFGIMSNTDKVGLGWQDNDKYSSGNGSTEITDDGQVMTTYTSNSETDFAGWDGKYNGQGLPKTWTGGVHYADKWNEDKDHLTGNYRYAMQDVELNGSTIVQGPADSLHNYVQNQTKNQFSKGDRHAIDAMYEWKIDTNTTLKITANAGSKHTETYSQYATNTSVLNNNTDTLPVFGTRNDRTITSNADGQFINADLLLRKKFAKKGRTLSIDVKENYKNNISSGYLHSLTDTTVSLHSDTVSTPGGITNQKKDVSSHTLAFSAKATYTEPLSKMVFMEVNYGVTVNNSTSRNYSYDVDNGNNVTRLNDTFSSDYKFNVLSNRGGLNFKFNTPNKKINFSLGSDVAYTNYVQTDLLTRSHDTTKNYFNLFPSASFTYKISKQTNLNVYYQGSTQQPSIAQIQPLRQNTDPLNVTIGNPDLKQEFIHNVRVQFNDYKVLTSRYLWLSASFTAVQDAFGTNQYIRDGTTTTQYINVKGNKGANLYAGGGFKVKNTNLFIGAQVNAQMTHNHNMLDSVANTNDNNSYGVGPYFNYEKENKYEFSLHPSYTYNDNRTTISAYATNYSVFNTEFSGSYQLPKKFEIGSSVDVMIREKTPVFTSNNNVVKWNAYLGKKFLKKSQLEARVSVFDILNQNIGYSRNASSGVITQNTYNTIRRYGMLNLIWNFTHTPAGTPPPSGGGMMIMH